MRTNFCPHRYGRWLLTAHSTAMAFLSVADRLASAFDHRWLEYPITRSVPLTSLRECGAGAQLAGVGV